MKMQNTSLLSRAAFLGLLFFSGCTTNDVAPIVTPLSVSISADIAGISEDQQLVEITATLSETSADLPYITIALSGTAVINEDYSISDTQIAIPANSLSGAVNLISIQDEIEEGNETIEISISSTTGPLFDGEQIVSVFIEDDDVPFQMQLIINEVLYDPSNSGLNGDANGDGVYVHAEDEFIELINLSTQAVDLSGYKIYDETALASGTPRHVIADGTIIPSGAALVIFGGGTPTGDFGGAIIQTSTTGNMNMSNAGDVMTITDTMDQVVLTFDIEPLSNNPNESYTRNPDITGDFEQHSASSPLLFSPGTRIDGSSF